MKVLLCIAPALLLAACVTTQDVAGTAGQIAKRVATEQVSPQLVLGAEAKCTAVIETAEPGTLDPAKLAQVEMLLEYMTMRHARREFVAELRLEAEILCGRLKQGVSGAAVAEAAKRRKAAIEAYRARSLK